MQEADLWVETNALQRGRALGPQQRIQKRDRRIDSVARWSPGAAIDRECGWITAQMVAKYAKIVPSCIALHSTEFVKIASLGQLDEDLGDAPSCAADQG